MKSRIKRRLLGVDMMNQFEELSNDTHGYCKGGGGDGIFNVVCVVDIIILSHSIVFNAWS